MTSPLERIPLIARVAVFACGEIKRLLVFGAVTQVWRDTVVVYRHGTVMEASDDESVTHVRIKERDRLLKYGSSADILTRIIEDNDPARDFLFDTFLRARSGHAQRGPLHLAATNKNNPHIFIALFNTLARVGGLVRAGIDETDRSHLSVLAAAVQSGSVEVVEAISEASVCRDAEPTQSATTTRLAWPASASGPRTQLSFQRRTSRAVGQIWSSPLLACDCNPRKVPLEDTVRMLRALLAMSHPEDDDEMETFKRHHGGRTVRHLSDFATLRDFNALHLAVARLNAPLVQLLIGDAEPSLQIPVESETSCGWTILHVLIDAVEQIAIVCKARRDKIDKKQRSSNSAAEIAEHQHHQCYRKPIEVAQRSAMQILQIPAVRRFIAECGGASTVDLRVAQYRPVGSHRHTGIRGPPLFIAVRAALFHPEECGFLLTELLKINPSLPLSSRDNFSRNNNTVLHMLVYVYNRLCNDPSPTPAATLIAKHGGKSASAARLEVQRLLSLFIREHAGVAALATNARNKAHFTPVEAAVLERLPPNLQVVSAADAEPSLIPIFEVLRDAVYGTVVQQQQQEQQPSPPPLLDPYQCPRRPGETLLHIACTSSLFAVKTVLDHMSDVHQRQRLILSTTQIGGATALHHLCTARLFFGTFRRTYEVAHLNPLVGNNNLMKERIAILDALLDSLPDDASRTKLLLAQGTTDGATALHLECARIFEFDNGFTLAGLAFVQALTQRTIKCGGRDAHEQLVRQLKRREFTGAGSPEVTCLDLFQLAQSRLLRDNERHMECKSALDGIIQGLL